ncbi:protein-glutamate methylesterase/protein-glutamine glutaminase [Haliangium sp.]|uniref:protein-glutamate methylesterase/protein-glutamine glutaminase n=1 Tax=Haliangium sp. TaxID=2663208 RepID=UPI003D0CDC41
MPEPRLRVLIVDDSMFMRATIERTLADLGRFEVVGSARDGREAVAQVQALRPDVITMDYNMPGMNGAETVRAIMQARPTPVIMFSAHTRQGARETFEALAAGAVDFVTKPHGEVSADISAIAPELADKLTAAARSRPRALAPIRAPARDLGQRRITLPPTGVRLVVIAVSTGGPAALSRVIPALPPATRFATVVVQHMPAQFTRPLAERLDSLSAVEVREAAAGDLPRPGLVLVAPGDRHLSFDERGCVVLSDTPPVNGCRPAADVTMASAAAVYGRRTIAVVMTGMGKDGAAGVAAVKAAEGRALAQDRDSSVIFGMPKAAIETGAVDHVVPLDDIAKRLRFM